MHRVADTLEFLDRSIIRAAHTPPPALGLQIFGQSGAMLVDVDTEWPSNKAVMGAHAWVGLSARPPTHVCSHSQDAPVLQDQRPSRFVSGGCVPVGSQKPLTPKTTLER
jgi:hypothetical protein